MNRQTTIPVQKNAQMVNIIAANTAVAEMVVSAQKGPVVLECVSLRSLSQRITANELRIIRICELVDCSLFVNLFVNSYSDVCARRRFVIR